jgi:hypothetical protein
LSFPCTRPPRDTVADLQRLTRHISTAMTSNGMATQATFPPSQVLEAMLTMRSSDTEQKKKAHAFLESFQKSVGRYEFPWREVQLLTLPPIDKRMDNDLHDTAVGRRARCEAVCCNNPQRQGELDSQPSFPS